MAESRIMLDNIITTLNHIANECFIVVIQYALNISTFVRFSALYSAIFWHVADVEFHSEINYLGVVVSSSHCITDQHMRKKFHLIIRVTTELLIKAKIALHDDLGCCHMRLFCSTAGISKNCIETNWNIKKLERAAAANTYRDLKNLINGSFEENHQMKVYDKTVGTWDKNQFIRKF